jgi:hypothetical protein
MYSVSPKRTAKLQFIFRQTNDLSKYLAFLGEKRLQR